MTFVGFPVIFEILPVSLLPESAIAVEVELRRGRVEAEEVEELEEEEVDEERRFFEVEGETTGT
jgi:hypothetical protein